MPHFTDGQCDTNDSPESVEEHRCFDTAYLHKLKMSVKYSYTDGENVALDNLMHYAVFVCINLHPLSLRTTVTLFRHVQVVFTATLKTHARNFKKANKSPASNLCHIRTCFEIIRGFSQFLQALVNAGPLDRPRMPYLCIKHARLMPFDAI